MAGDAEGALVYSGPQNISIGAGFSQNLNLNGDAFGDVTLLNSSIAGSPYQSATVNFSPGKLVGFTAGPSNFAYVSALSPGFLIGSSTVGPSFTGSMAFGASNPNAQFNNAPDAYIGLSFPIAGNTHYGWVRVAVNNALRTFVVKDWAYESSPGVGVTIAAIPEAGTLGVLAAGAAGVALLRRRECRENDSTCLGDTSSAVS
jgi:hypothetical protein